MQETTVWEKCSFDPSTRRTKQVLQVIVELSRSAQMSSNSAILHVVVVELSRSTRGRRRTKPFYTWSSSN